MFHLCDTEQLFRNSKIEPGPNSDCSEVPPFSLNDLELKLCFRKMEEVWNVVFPEVFSAFIWELQIENLVWAQHWFRAAFLGDNWDQEVAAKT